MSNYRDQWTEGQLTVLREGWADPYTTISRIAFLVGRSDSAVASKGKKLDLGRKATSCGSGWTDAKEQQLRELWTAGKSGGEIAKLIRGFTRNAIIGKAIRLGLEGRAAPSEPPSKLSAPPVPRNTKQGMGYNFKRSTRALKVNAGNQVFVEPEARPARAEIKAKAWEALPGSTPRPFEERLPLACRWPIGSDLLSCCEPAPFGPYCECHRQMAYASPKTNAWHLKKTLHKVAA